MKSERLNRTSHQRAPFEGSYIYNHNRSVRFVLDRGNFQWGWLEGKYKVLKHNTESIVLALIHGFYEERKHPKQYRLTRRRTAYVLTELSSGEETIFKRADKKVFLTDSFSKAPPRRRGIPAEDPKQKCKHVEESKIYYELTGDSVVKAVSIPHPPSSKTPTIVRVTHSNSLGRVDSKVFVRLGNPKEPLEWNDFDTVSDWREACLLVGPHVGDHGRLPFGPPLRFDAGIISSRTEET